MATLKQGKKILEIFEDVSREKLQGIFESGILAEIRDADIARITPDVRNAIRALFGLNPVMAKARSDLLERIDTITVPATTQKFIARDRLGVNTGRKARVKISYLEDNFLSWFGGKIEDPIAETSLCCNKLRRPSVDGPILAELSGGAMAETTLTEMFSLMERQGSGEKGILLASGYANIFYVRDVFGALRAVGCRWDGGGWFVFADSVEYPSRWHGGRRVFSRNS